MLIGVHQLLLVCPHGILEPRMHVARDSSPNMSTRVICRSLMPDCGGVQQPGLHRTQAGRGRNLYSQKDVSISRS